MFTQKIEMFFFLVFEMIFLTNDQSSRHAENISKRIHTCMYIGKNVARKQGDLIARIFANWAIGFLGQFFFKLRK
jgi:hypothetical protein